MTRYGKFLVLSLVLSLSSFAFAGTYTCQVKSQRQYDGGYYYYCALNGVTYSQLYSDYQSLIKAAASKAGVSVKPDDNWIGPHVSLVQDNIATSGVKLGSLVGDTFSVNLETGSGSIKKFSKFFVALTNSVTYVSGHGAVQLKSDSAAKHTLHVSIGEASWS